MFVVPQDDFAIHDGRQKAIGFLLEPSGATREIIGQLGHLRLNRLRIENHDIGVPAFAQQAAAGQLPMGGRHEAQLVHRVFQSQGFFLTHPVTQQMGLQGRIHDL